jgi:hypothetical protein
MYEIRYLGAKPIERIMSILGSGRYSRRCFEKRRKHSESLPNVLQILLMSMYVHM